MISVTCLDLHQGDTLCRISSLCKKPLPRQALSRAHFGKAARGLPGGGKPSGEAQSFWEDRGSSARLFLGYLYVRQESLSARMNFFIGGIGDVTGRTSGGSRTFGNRGAWPLPVRDPQGFQTLEASRCSSPNPVSPSCRAARGVPPAPLYQPGCAGAEVVVSCSCQADCLLEETCLFPWSISRVPRRTRVPSSVVNSWRAARGLACSVFLFWF